MDDREAQIAAGRGYAQRYLLMSLYMQYLFDKRDKPDFARKFADRTINAVDKLLPEANGDATFRHAALHEVETFWKTLLSSLPGHSPEGPRQDA